MKFEDIKVVSVFGSGTMGHGIAQVMAQQGYKTFLRDISQELIEAGLHGIKKSLQKAIEKEVLTKELAEATLSRIIITTDVEDAARAGDFIIEAIPEDLELKKDFFKQLNGICKDEAILATNTSTLSITEIGSATNRPEKVIGTHFFNPVVLMGFVEIIKGLLTSEQTTLITKKLVSKLGKESITVADSPGFATGRLGIAQYLEASRMLEEGVASVEDIDKGMRLGYSHRMGPFETADLVGLDARLNNINALYESTRDPFWKPPLLLKRLVTAGYLGKKPGSKGGYYTYFG